MRVKLKVGIKFARAKYAGADHHLAPGTVYFNTNPAARGGNDLDLSYNQWFWVLHNASFTV